MWLNPVPASASVTSTSGLGPTRQPAEQLEDQPVVVDKRRIGLFGRQRPRPLRALQPAAGGPQQRHGHFAVDGGAVVNAVPDIADQGVFVALQVLGDVGGRPFGDHELVGTAVRLDDGPEQPGGALQLGQAAGIERPAGARGGVRRRTSAG